MLEYAEHTLYGVNDSGEKYLRVYVNDFDSKFEELVKACGYEIAEKYNRPMSALILNETHPIIDLPERFKIKSLADDNDLGKIHRVLWRGFNHPGEPPEDEIADREKMQSGPNFRKDLTIVIEAPSGDFVSFCGMWYESTNKIAYVEPVATDPEFRRMGLARAAILEGVHRCRNLGAQVAYVGSDQPIYVALGFEKVFESRCWIKYL
jgi:predicted N-acetyltransferase YhbS